VHIFANKHLLMVCLSRCLGWGHGWKLAFTTTILKHFYSNVLVI
jgi:hypothetical protein